MSGQKGQYRYNQGPTRCQTEAHEEERLDQGDKDVSAAITHVAAAASKLPEPVPIPS